MVNFSSLTIEIERKKLIEVLKANRNLNPKNKRENFLSYLTNELNLPDNRIIQSKLRKL